MFKSFTKDKNSDIIYDILLNLNYMVEVGRFGLQNLEMNNVVPINRNNPEGLDGHDPNRFKILFKDIATRLDENFEKNGQGDSAKEFKIEQDNLKMELIYLLSHYLKNRFEKNDLYNLIVEVEAKRTDHRNEGMNNKIYLEALDAAYIDRPKLKGLKRKV